MHKMLEERRMWHVANANQIKTFNNIYTLIAVRRERDRVPLCKTCFGFFGQLLLFYDTRMLVLPLYWYQRTGLLWPMDDGPFDGPEVLSLGSLRGWAQVIRYAQKCLKKQNEQETAQSCNLKRCPAAPVCPCWCGHCKAIAWKCAKNVRSLAAARRSAYRNVSESEYPRLYADAYCMTWKNTLGCLGFYFGCIKIVNATIIKFPLAWSV